MQQSNNIADSEITLKSELSLRDTVSSKFNDIRYPQYRIAQKLRYLQKVSNFHLIDLFNTLESFREFGLNGNPDLKSLMPNSQAYSVISSIFVQLSQRIPNAQALNIQYSTDLLYNWIVDTFDINQSGFINIFALKIALTLLCSATYSNKLRYLFTLLSNDGTALIETHFDLFLRFTLAIAQYFEDISIFFYDEDLHATIFDFQSTTISLQKFIEVLTCFQSQADFTSWLIVYHRLSDAEKITHQTSCDACGKNSFHGFRYKCKKCTNYNLCQECFWSGKSSGNHDPDKHPIKEYLLEKPKNQFRQSIRKSFRSSFRRPAKAAAEAAAAAAANRCYQDGLTRKQLNLRHIISSPQLRKRDASLACEYRFHDIVNSQHAQSLSNLSNADDERNLIAHYLHLLQNKSEKNPHLDDALTSGDVRSMRTYEQTIEQLEMKNRQLMQRIGELKESKIGSPPHARENQISPEPIVLDSSPPPPPPPPPPPSIAVANAKNAFFDELLVLRRRKDSLEEHLNSLQDRRKLLMVQLDNLMKEFKDFTPPVAAAADDDDNDHDHGGAMNALIDRFASSSSITVEQPQYSNHYSRESGDDHRDLSVGLQSQRQIAI